MAEIESTECATTGEAWIGDVLALGVLSLFGSGSTRPVMSSGEPDAGAGGVQPSTAVPTGTQNLLKIVLLMCF